MCVERVGEGAGKEEGLSSSRRGDGSGTFPFNHAL